MIRFSIFLVLITLCCTNVRTYIPNLNWHNLSTCPILNFVDEYQVKLKLGNFSFCPTNSFWSNCLSWISDYPVSNEYNEKSKKNINDVYGGWFTQERDRIAQPGKCSIDKISAKELDLKSFLREYAFAKPVVIVNATDNKEFQEYTKYKSLIQHYGHTTVKLSSANSYSYENQLKTFKDYCKSHLKPQSLSTLGNETFYFFGDNNNEEWFDLLNKYNHPPYFLPGHSPQLSFGVAGPGSGVPFHFHGPGFAETLWGRKRWFMYPPESSPPFHPNRTTLQWLHEDYLNLRKDSKLLECTLNPGELIYFPDHWWHATLNIDTTVFMSTFLSP